MGGAEFIAGAGGRARLILIRGEIRATVQDGLHQRALFRPAHFGAKAAEG
jgi:hypothetical protein